MILPALLLVPALAACGSGIHSAQYKESETTDAASATVGGVAVRNAYITAPAAKGGATTASFTVAQLLPGADSLTAAASSISNDVQVYVGGKQAFGVPVTDSGAQVTLQLTELTDDVQADHYYPVTLSFAQAGQVTLDVPVLRPGIVPAGSTSTPTAIPEQPIGVPPLDQRAPSSAAG